MLYAMLRNARMMAERFAATFAKSGYAVLRRVLANPGRSFLYDYAFKSARNGQLRPGDGDVADTPCYYGDPFMESLLEMLLPRIEAESGLALFPTYSYLRVYKTGDALNRHRDRPSCEVSVTLNLGYEAAAPWPIWLEVAGAARSFALRPGDALLYQGTVLPHWRESFVGAHSVQVFLHYVDRNGPCNSWKYDGRPALATTPVTLRIMEQFRASLSLGTTGIGSPESSHTLASS